MFKFSLLFGLMLIAVNVFGQDTLIAPRKSTNKTYEAGVMMQAYMADIGSGKTDLGVAGIQYRKGVNEMLGYRIMAAYGIYNHDSRPYRVGYLQDTIYEKYASSTINMGMTGGALEVQRRFYKAVYFYAAVEVKLGYGTGHVDTSTMKQYKETETGIITSKTESAKLAPNISMVYAGVSPALGVKIALKHLVLGMELQTLNFSYQNEKNRDIKTSQAFFDMANARQCFFIHYRF